MAGPFPLHKLILSEFQLHQPKWKDELKQIQCHGPEFASHVSNLESAVVFFNRERTLLAKLTVPRNQQMRMFIFWQITKQVGAHLKAVNLDPIISMLQQLHLQLSQGKKSKATNVPGFVQAFALHQLRSTYWICMSACDLMRRGYDQYGSTVIMSHLMPISIAVMAVFSRLTLILSRAAYFCASAYNTISQFCNTDPESLPTIAQWDFFVGPTDRSLTPPDHVQWEDLSHQMTVSDDDNRKELDKLNLQLQRKADEDDDDLGEELDEALIYKPAPSSSKPTSKPLPTPKPSPVAPPKVTEKRIESKQSSSSAPQSEHKSKDRPKDKLKEKRSDVETKKDVKSGKEAEKTKIKTFDDDDFELLWQAPKDSGSQKKKYKDKHKHKDKPSGHKDDKHSEESKKRKKAVAAASDEIDDLFGLLTPNIKKSKHN